MPEPHPPDELHQPRPHGRHPGPRRDPQPSYSPPHQQRVTRRIRRRHASSRRVCSGRPPSCRRKLSSIRAGKDTAAGSPNPPASSVGDSPRGNSSKAKGFPRVSATIWSLTRSSSDPVSAESSSARASSARRPCTGSPASRPGKPWPVALWTGGSGRGPARLIIAGTQSPGRGGLPTPTTHYDQPPRRPHTRGLLPPDRIRRPPVARRGVRRRRRRAST